MICLELETDDEAQFLLELLLDPFTYAERMPNDAAEEIREQLMNRLDDTIRRAS